MYVTVMEEFGARSPKFTFQFNHLLALQSWMIYIKKKKKSPGACFSICKMGSWIQLLADFVTNECDFSYLSFVLWTRRPVSSLSVLHFLRWQWCTNNESNHTLGVICYFSLCPVIPDHSHPPVLWVLTGTIQAVSTVGCGNFWCSSMSLSSGVRLNWNSSSTICGLPWGLRRYRFCLQCRRPRFDPWLGKIPWRRKWQHSSILVWEIPWTEEPGGLHSMGSQKRWTRLSN